MSADTAETKGLFPSILARRTYYSLTNKCPISDERVKEIVEFAVKNCPSSYNVQSARAVIVVGEQHQKLWDMALDMVKTLPEQAQQALIPRTQGFRGAYGSVMWFEDQDDLAKLADTHKSIAHVIPEWSDHSSGMHQFTVWTALEAEGCGCNLQHYNYSDDFTAAVRKEWDLPSSWNLKSQLVFGEITGPTYTRTYKPLDGRVKLIS